MSLLNDLKNLATDITSASKNAGKKAKKIGENALVEGKKAVDVTVKLSRKAGQGAVRAGKTAARLSRKAGQGAVRAGRGAVAAGKAAADKVKNLRKNKN